MPDRELTLKFPVGTFLQYLDSCSDPPRIFKVLRYNFKDHRWYGYHLVEIKSGGLKFDLSKTFVEENFCRCVSKFKTAPKTGFGRFIQKIEEVKHGHPLYPSS